MGKCIFCGLDAGFFSSKHKQCEVTHAIALAEFNTCVKDYFAGSADVLSVSTTLANLRRTSFLTKNDVLMIVCKEIDSFTSMLAFSIKDSVMKYVQDFVACVNLTPAEINNYGESLRKLKQKYEQSKIIDKLRNGTYPSNQNCPILLSCGESLVYIYNNVTMLQEKVEKEYSGNRSGWSFRVMKGVTYHTGSTKLKPIEHSHMNKEGVGTFYITTHNLIFQSDSIAIKIPYKKIIGITPYSNGIDIHREGNNIKRLLFHGFSGDFIMHLLPYIII